MVDVVGGAGSGAAGADEDVEEKLHNLVVRAVSDAWIRVELDGGEPFEVLLKEGERVKWDGAEFSLLIGNAGGVELNLDGEPVVLSGGEGEVVRITLPALEGGGEDSEDEEG
ncbi:MAG: DUF4115 domain-containing protein [Thermodesulfobacteriota bacterium]